MSGNTVAGQYKCDCGRVGNLKRRQTGKKLLYPVCKCRPSNIISKERALELEQLLRTDIGEYGSWWDESKRPPEEKQKMPTDGQAEQNQQANQSKQNLQNDGEFKPSITEDEPEAPAVTPEVDAEAKADEPSNTPLLVGAVVLVVGFFAGKRILNG